MSTANSPAIPNRASWLSATWIVLLAVWTLALVTPQPAQIRQQVLPGDSGMAIPVSKLVHLSAYAFLTAFGAFLPRRADLRWLPLLVLSLHGFGSEYWQTFVPLRHGCWSDVAIDHVGIVIGFLCTLKCWLPRR